MQKKKSKKYKEAKNLINWLLKKEELFNYNSTSSFQLFYKNISKHKKIFRDLILNLNDSKKTILGYGASTKGNVILQFCNLSSKHLPFIAEVNKFKFNRYTPGSKIKIISEYEAKKMNPDYFLVLPWHFKNHIIKKENKYLKNGGKLIFPLPDIDII